MRLPTYIYRLLRSPMPRRKITEAEIKRVRTLAEASNEKWAEVFTSLAKWIFATLITLGTGGIYLVLTLGLHPAAVASALPFFLGSLLAALVGAVSILLAASEKISFADRISSSPKPEEEEVSEGEVERYMRSNSGLGLAMFAAILSFALVGSAGSKISGGIRPCSAGDLEISLEIGEAIAYGHRSSRSCYFYEIEGLSNDPLERAKQELALINKLSTLDHEKDENN